jgi:hypothetical protein
MKGHMSEDKGLTVTRSTGRRARSERRFICSHDQVQVLPKFDASHLSLAVIPTTDFKAHRANRRERIDSHPKA